MILRAVITQIAYSEVQMGASVVRACGAGCAPSAVRRASLFPSNGRRVGGLDRRVLEHVIDGVSGDHAVSCVVSDGIVEELRGVRVKFFVVFTGDLGSQLVERVAGLGIQIGARDLDSLADVAGSDTFGQFVSSLIGILRDPAMAVLVIDKILRRPVGK